MKPFELAVLGEVAIDVILAGVDEVPKSWSKLGKARTAGLFTAGSGGYVAQCYSKLGGRAAIVGRIGDDQAGKMILEGFRQNNVSTRYLLEDEKVRTEVSTVIVYNNGNKASIVNEIPSLDHRFLDSTFLEETKVLHIGAYLLIPTLWGNTIRRLLRKATRESVLVSLDPQMSATGQWSKAFQGVFEHLNILLLDEREAICISRKKRLIDAIEYLHANGVETVGVKTGRRGATVSRDGKVYSVRGLRPKVVSTIGAGDAFDAAFIYGLLRNWPLRKVTEFSNAAGGVSTTRLGCMTAIPRAKVLERLARAYYG